MTNSFGEVTMDMNENGTDWNSDLFKGYPAPLLHLAACCCILFMLVGIPGNLITIIALFRYKKVRNATAVFIMNLSFSDLLFCCFNLPLAASLFWQRSWPHGELLCQLFPLARYGLLAVSLFSVLAITINRYIMIGHPRLYPKIYKSHYLICMVLLTWLLGFGALVPTWLGRWGRFGLDTQIGSCSILHDDRGNSPKVFLFVIAFVIPCLSILVCYFRIFYIVRKTAKKSRSESGNKAVPMRKPTALQKNEMGINVKSNIKEQCLNNEDSAIGTLSTTATLTDKTCTENDKFPCKSEGTSYLDSSSFNNDSYIIESSPTKSTKQLNIDENNLLKTNESLVNNNACEVHDLLKKKSNINSPNPHLLSPPTEKYNKIKKINFNEESTSASHSCNNDHIDNVSSLNSPFMKETNNSKNNTCLNTENHIKQLKSTENLSNKVCCNWLSSSITSIFQDKKNYKCNYSPQDVSNKNQYVTGKVTSKDKRILKMIVVIFLSFFICYLPITIAKTSTLKDSKYFNIAGYILIYLTPCINPLIYVVMSSEYRQAYKNLLTCKAPNYEGSGRST